MKWVKVAIGAVIAILSVSIIATSVYDMTKTETISYSLTFTVGEQISPTSGFYGEYEITPNIYNDLESSGFLTGDVDVFKNDMLIVSNSVYEKLLEPQQYNYVINTYLFKDGQESFSDFYIGNGFVAVKPSTGFATNDVIRLDITNVIPPQLTGITATLILLAPLIFAGGVLAYLLNKQNY